MNDDLPPDELPPDDATRPPTEEDLPKASGLAPILALAAVGLVIFYFAANVCNLR